MAPFVRYVFVSFLLLGTLFAQDRAQSKVGLPVDWSFRHLLLHRDWRSSEPTARQEPRGLYNWMVRERAHAQASGHKSKTKSRVDWSFTLGAGRVAANMYPAKYTFDPGATPSCTDDYAVFGLNVAGTSSQPNLVRFNNLYSEPGGTGLCTGATGPSVLSAYNVTTSGDGRVLTSPSISLDGRQVAFIETVTSPTAASIFHVLTFGTTGTNGSFNTGTNTYSAVAPGGGGGTDAVMTSLAYSTAATTFSSPWVDYHNNVVYFGDDNGNLYKTTCAFNCTIAPAIAAGWPITVAAGVSLGPPVVDPVSNKLFVGGSDGKFYMLDLTVCPATCTVNSMTVGSANTFGGIIDAPLVDPVFQTVFAFTGDNGAGAGIVAQFNTSLTPLASVSMGSTAAFNVLSGAFDDAYYGNTLNGAAQGHLYACGATGGSRQPALYTMAFSGTNITASNPPLMGSGSHQNIPGNPGIGCSPLTEFMNGTDRLFFSQSQVPSKKCTSATPVDGCIFMYTLGASGPSVNPQATAVENNGTSAIIVDNTSAQPQTSSIYFSNQSNATCTIGAGGPAFCAIKLTQSALQ